MMKIALVHELLTMRGGAERVFKILADMFPDAPIYTLLYDESKLGEWFPHERVRTSTLQNSIITHYSLLTTHSINHHLYLPRFPATVEAFDFSAFDLVISSSSAFTHGIITNGTPKHLCYVHSPARYLWDRTHDVLEQTGHGLFGALRRAYLSRVFHRLRTWDAEAAARPDMLLAASKEVQRRIELYWRRESEVITPPVDDFWLEETIRPKSQVRSPKSYYLVVSTLARYKRLDLAIAACNQLGVPLTVVGEGSDRARLERMAGPTITFSGLREHDELRDLYANATATIFPGEEDFGLVPLETMACGTPTIAFRGGGALETIKEGETGVFFDEPTAESLASALETFDPSRFNQEKCRGRAKEFSRERFETAIRNAIDQQSIPI